MNRIQILFYAVLFSVFSTQAGANTILPAVPDAFSTGPYAVEKSLIDIDDEGSPRIFTLFIPKEASGKIPVVHFQHGFLNNHAWYGDFLSHLASHGYIVVSSQSIHGIFGGDTSAEEAEKVYAFIEWLKSDLPKRLKNIEPDFDKFGVAGHSRGGKVTNHLLNSHPDIAKAFFGVDPVDTEPPIGNDPSSLDSPVNFKGDSFFLGTEIGGSCAPEGHNSIEFFNKYPASSRNLVAKGVGHADMLDKDGYDDCGLICNLCDSSEDEQLNKSFRNYIGGLMVAFFGSSLKSQIAYDLILENTDSHPFENSQNNSNPLWYVISQANDGGSITPQSQRVKNNQTAEVSIESADDYQVVNVSGCGGNWDGSDIYSTGAITSHCTIEAIFAKAIEPDFFSIEPINIASKQVIFSPNYEIEVAVSGKVNSDLDYSILLYVSDSLSEKKPLSIDENGVVIESQKLIFSCPQCTVPSEHNISIEIAPEDSPNEPLASTEALIKIAAIPQISISGIIENQTLSADSVDIELEISGSQDAISKLDKIEITLDNQVLKKIGLSSPKDGITIIDYSLNLSDIENGNHEIVVNAYLAEQSESPLTSQAVTFKREIDSADNNSSESNSSEDNANNSETGNNEDDNQANGDDIKEEEQNAGNSSSGGSGSMLWITILILGCISFIKIRNKSFIK